MSFYTTKMQNNSTRKDEVTSLMIYVEDALSGEHKGLARMVSFDDIYLELPEKQGRYAIKANAQKELLKHHISNLTELWHKKWLVDNGDYILRNLEPVAANA